MVELRATTSTSTGGGLRWTSRSDDPAQWIDVHDPVIQIPHRPGDRVVFCWHCYVAYRPESVLFLQQQNAGRCVSCLTPNQFQTVVLPLAPAPGATIPAGSPRPTPAPPVVPAAFVDLARLKQHIGQVVDFRGEVKDVYRSRSSGTYFIKFEETAKPYDGFTLVIFSNYARKWRDLGKDPFDYDGEWIQVHGLIQEHPTWGTQILTYTPEVITVLDGPPAPAKIRWVN